MRASSLFVVLGLYSVQVLGWVGPRRPNWPANEFDHSNTPGSLVLTMLIKNEAENLKRSLPLWAQVTQSRTSPSKRGVDFFSRAFFVLRLQVADAWVIGLDDNNTDTSEVTHHFAVCCCR